MQSLGMISRVVYLLLLIAAFLNDPSIIQVECLSISYSRFNRDNQNDFIFTEHAGVDLDAIQVTPDVSAASLFDYSGRVWYGEPFKLHSRSRNSTASFNSTFVLNITPRSDPGGEGLAFILTGEAARSSIPDDSTGQWLGMVNAGTNGTVQASIVAVEFDTRKSYPEDMDSNHVGVDVNSVYSIRQVGLGGHGVNLSSTEDVTASVRYDGASKTLAIFVSMTNETGDNSMEELIISMHLDLSEHLSENVYVGFSASTGGDTAQLNCIRAWNFTSTIIDDDDTEELLWVWIMVPVSTVALLSSLVIYRYLKRKTKERNAREEDRKLEIQIQSSETAPQKFRLKELKHATGNFNCKNELGKGGFGTVYKGLIENKEVAVKRFSKNSSQGRQDFIAEVTIIGNLRHRNLVKLVGWCYENDELLLVYEFMPNRSLDKLVFSQDSQASLTWERRHSIICGVAGALDYLHNGCEKRVLHRDIKASNIMLDSEFNARLGDFGLARTIQLGEKTHHSTKEIAGTPGYMAPESFHVGRATVETDVYAFGVLLLEVICARKPGNQNEENNYSNRIVDWVWELFSISRILDAVDVRMGGKFDREEAECALLLGLACCHPNPYHRPSMKSALRVLTGEAAPPPIPVDKPAFMWPAIAPSFEEKWDGSDNGDPLTESTALFGR